MAQRTVDSEGTEEQAGLNRLWVNMFSSAEDYCFSRKPGARSVPKMDPLPLDLIIAILQEIKGETDKAPLCTIHKDMS